MKYTSTRDTSVSLSSAEAILQGISRDGGLLIPEYIPALSGEDFKKLAAMTYPERAAYVLSLFLTDFARGRLLDMALSAYGNNWDNGRPAPTVPLGVNTFALELWHGPTCAFKDAALQMLPRLTSEALSLTGERRDVMILVATSGDTGKAALEGFRDVPRVNITVFYPEQGVSDIQKLQMTTQEGANVRVAAVRGNFDDAQNGVKRIFANAPINEKLGARGFILSSANSINWGRLAPQIVYYISSYLDLAGGGQIAFGDKIDYAVPTGNFGNILAGYYAREMGLPIRRLICASNSNDVLRDFIKTGVYDANRAFIQTISPSMDILISSNLERLLFHLAGRDGAVIRGYMSDLKKSGRFEVSEKLHTKLRSLFSGDALDDSGAMSVIEKTFHGGAYLLDPHTAVAYGCLNRIREAERDTESDTVPTVVVGTASPFKFAGSVLSALGETPPENGFDQIARLETLTNVRAPRSLTGLREKEIRFKASVNRDDMENFVIN